MELTGTLRLFKLPPDSEALLFLISEEMKNRRHINRLASAGFDTTHTCDLSKLILTLCGFKELSDELFEWYDASLDTACMKASPADAEAWKEAVVGLYAQIRDRGR